MIKKAKKISEISESNLQKRVSDMNQMTNDFMKDIDSLHVYISKGNTKTGSLVPSVSLRPMIDCKNCKSCFKLCYDMRNDCVYKEVRRTRSRNAAIYKSNPERYFREISGACKSFASFRWHIGGDIVNIDYLEGMIKVANENKHCKFLCFTKRYDLVNKYLDEGNTIPGNLQIVFSCWIGLDTLNPHNLPTSHALFADGSTTAKDGAYWCSGNCSVCLIKNQGCWSLKKGESVIFLAH